MNRDLYIGATVSLVVHFGSAFVSQHFKQDAPIRLKTLVDDGPRIEIHPLPVEDVEPLVTVEKIAKPVDLAPPSLPDVPRLVEAAPFVIKTQPPPISAMNTGMITIPEGSFDSGRHEVMVDFDKLDQKPRAILQNTPVYPDSMKKQGITATVLVGFIVDSTGSVLQARVISSSQREFDASALKAVERWRFKAGIKNGRPVTTTMQVPIVFKITDADR